ncbi:Maf family protein, partial [Enterobacter cloacae]
LQDEAELERGYVLAADTVVAVGRRILPKAETSEDAAFCLQLLSGRSHRVYTGVCLITPSGKQRQRLVETRVRFKRLPRIEIDRYVASGEWRG